MKARPGSTGRAFVLRDPPARASGGARAVTAGLGLAQRVGSPTVEVERLASESLFRRFVRFRKSLGFEIVPLTGGAAQPLEHLRERLRWGRVVGLLG